MEDGAERARMARMLRPAISGGNQTLVVHGGGKQLTVFLDKNGIRSEFLNGLRITSAEALDGVVKVFAGTVNHGLLAALHAEDIPAVGISGVDAGCLEAERLRGAQGEDWGFVGRITSARPQVWEAILAGGMLPVMACLAVDREGQIYNVNADQAAVACALHWRADALIFLTDVDGVRDATGQIVARLAAEDISSLIDSGAVTGGMLAKLHAVEEALAGGVTQILIRNGRRRGALDNFFLGNAPAAGSPAGTVIISSLPVEEKI